MPNANAAMSILRRGPAILASCCLAMSVAIAIPADRRPPGSHAER
jgi:hypothetical protein